jgi:hypothetical protein
MALEDTFNGATNAFSLAFAYINTVAQEIGMEQALALDAKTWEAMGAAQGKTMKDRQVPSLRSRPNAGDGSRSYRGPMPRWRYQVHGRCS